jgi:hypothetical protein
LGTDGLGLFQFGGVDTALLCGTRTLHYIYAQVFPPALFSMERCFC